MSTPVDVLICGGYGVADIGRRILRNGDTALVYSSWAVNGTGPDGPVVMTGDSKVVVREQADGTWKFAIEDPGWHAGG